MNTRYQVRRDAGGNIIVEEDGLIAVFFSYEMGEAVRGFLRSEEQDYAAARPPESHSKAGAPSTNNDRGFTYETSR